MDVVSNSQPHCSLLSGFNGQNLQVKALFQLHNYCTVTMAFVIRLREMEDYMVITYTPILSQSLY